MKQHHKKSIFAVLCTLVLTATATASMGAASADYAAPAVLPATVSEEVEAMAADDSISLLSLSSSDYDKAIAPPKLEYKIYNTAVSYRWYVVYDGYRIALGKTEDNLIVENATEKIENVFAYGGVKHCYAYSYYARAYFPETKKYSYNYVTSRDIVYLDDGTEKVIYGKNCRYAPTMNYRTLDVTQNIPTGWDETNFIWYHNGKTGNVIKATIKFQNSLADIEVIVPWIGYKTSYVTINGVEFGLRTGPNRVSVKCNTSGYSEKFFDFAFATV